MDDLLTLDFYQDQDGQRKIAVCAGDLVIFTLRADQLDAGYKMCVWRNSVLSRAWIDQRRAA